MSTAAKNIGKKKPIAKKEIETKSQPTVAVVAEEPEINFIPLKINDFDYNIEQNDLFMVGDSLLASKGLVSHHLDSVNRFYEAGISQIITQYEIKKDILMKKIDPASSSNAVERVVCEVIAQDIKMKPPTIQSFMTKGEQILWPKDALVQDKIYSATLYVSCLIKATAYMKNKETKVREAKVENFKICKVPIIKRSILCNTYKKSKEELMAMGEDPSDPGGNFIVKGSEWAIEMTENITHNQWRIYINEGYGNQLARCELISKPGDSYQNSDYLMILYKKNNTIAIVIDHDQFKDVEIPFFILFRALGYSTDKQILDEIVMDYEADANKQIFNICIEALAAKYSPNETEKLKSYKDVHKQADALKALVDMIPEERMKVYNLRNDKDNYPNAIELILGKIDIHLLPHIGKEPEHRRAKVRFLGMLIRKVLLTHLGHIPQSDRDGYRIKRIHAAGENYAKAFKTYYNQTIVQPIKRQMMKIFTSTSFDLVDLANMFKTALATQELERLVVQTIISGNKASLKIKRSAIVNRLAAQQLHRKNQLNVIATLRMVVATSSESAKQSERASEMRRVHMSALGFICVAHSPVEGEKVGINKQLAIFATIAPSSSSEVLKKILMSDNSIVRGDLAPVDIYRGNWGYVFVNGYPIGFCRNNIDLAAKYRSMRRRLEINPYTTIYYDITQNELHFFVDYGRLCRPLMIVYNNRRDPEMFSETMVKSKSFIQGIAITQADIDALYAGNKTLEHLMQEQKIEFITPEEQENCFICYEFEKLREERGNELLEYTHCDIPQSQLGITALTAPFGNHNQPPRVVYQTSQAKQTAGCFALNWPFRMDKETFLQYTNETPLVRTDVNKYLFPNGNNVMVAITCYGGFNQEDSVIINQAAVDRGLLNGCKFTFYKTEKEHGEEIGNPDATKTDGIKSANYEKLHDGIVRKGQIIEEDDVLIGKYIQNPKGTSERAFTDRSVIYKESEEAIVSQVVQSQNEDDIWFCKVGLRKVRPLVVGDKLSSRSGQKGIAALLMREADMPFNAEGIRPAILFNPHGLPSRMTCAQLIEGLLGNVCAVKGTQADGTFFKKVDIESIADELEECGLHRYGYDRLYNGLTGEFIDVMIFHGPIYYQRLLKFVADAEYSVNKSLTDAITMQPVTGKSANGGLKIGEMEKDVLVSHGAAKFLMEKFYNHSDSYTEYICRCGKSAIVNKHDGIYKCKYCGDNADIVAVPTSWSSKLFIQEVESTNVGIRRIPEPFTYETMDDEKRSKSIVDNYDEQSLKALAAQAEDLIGDNARADVDE